MTRLRTAFLIASFCAAANAHAITLDSISIAPPGVVQVLRFVGGETITGRVTAVSDSVRFRTESATFSIHPDAIRDIRPVPSSSIRNGRHLPNLNATRLFFAPTGRMLRRGEFYLADYYLFFPALAIGVTDRFTLGGGTSIFPGVAPDDQAFYVTPKFGLHETPNSSVAIGALIVKPPFDDTDAIGILYGVGTFGSLHGSVTVGAGLGFVDGDLAERPMLMLGAEKRVSRRVSLITENWIYPGEDHPLISYGVRLFGDHLSVDLALLNTIGEEAIYPGVPYIDFVISFGK